MQLRESFSIGLLGSLALVLESRLMQLFSDGCELILQFLDLFRWELRIISALSKVALTDYKSHRIACLTLERVLQALNDLSMLTSFS